MEHSVCIAGVFTEALYRLQAELTELCMQLLVSRSERSREHVCQSFRIVQRAGENESGIL
jgi:hypothetical protein